MLVACRRLVAAVLCFAALLRVGAVFEDEVEQYEWMLRQIGKPTALEYSAEASDKIFVASASGVVASLSLKDGTMLWRRIPARPCSMRFLRASGKGLFSVTDGGFVQAWKSSSGDLTWQREYAEPVLDLILPKIGSKQVVLVVRAGELEARTTAGKHEWTIAAASVAPSARFLAAAPSEDEGGVCAVATSPDGAGATVSQLEAVTGKVLKKADLPDAVGKALQAGAFTVVDNQLVLLVDGTIAAYSMCGGGQTGESTSLLKLEAKDKKSFRLLPWQRTPGVFAATNGVTTAVFGVGSQGLKHLRTFEGVAVVGPVFSVHDDETAKPVALAIVKEEGTQIQLLDPASGNVQPAIHAQGYTAGDHGPAELLVVHELSSGEHRTVVSAADHSLVGIQGTKIDWVREEALASIDQAVFYSRSALVTSVERAARSAGPGGLAALTAQLSDLPAHLAEALGKPMEIASSLAKWLAPRRSKSIASMNLMPNAKVPTSSEELRDFGANKLILVMTRALKVFALEATTSEIIWQKYLGGTGAECGAAAGAGGSGAGCRPEMRLLPSSAAAYSELLVVAPAAAPGGKPTQQLYWIEPLEGKVLHQEVSPSTAGIVSVMSLPQSKAAQAAQVPDAVMPFIIVDNARKVYTMPSKSSTGNSKLVEESADKLFHYEVDTTANLVEGFVIGRTAEGQELVRLWNLELGSIGERILAAASPRHREWDHVPVHIKGDASILYKYINANLLAVVTEDVRSNVSSLNVYALDAVTGHVLHESHIPGGAKPVNLVLCDNWIIMHYRNPKRNRFELVVMEFFQAKADDGPWDILFGGKMANQTKSAHHLETPVPLQQTYIFNSGVTAMGVTATLKGITPRSVIMALTTEQLLRVSKDTLNPRRPYAPTSAGIEKDKASVPQQFAATKEEALQPYAALLPVKPMDVLTYYSPMPQVAGIISSPTALESTSIVFSFGLDLFFTPVQSAKAYDVLSPGFNYLLLYASVGVVFVLFIATSIFARHKALQDRWK